MGVVLIGLGVLILLGGVINAWWKGSNRREIKEKIDNAKEGLYDVGLEEKLQKAESQLHEAKDKLLNKSED